MTLHAALHDINSFPLLCKIKYAVLIKSSFHCFICCFDHIWDSPTGLYTCGFMCVSEPKNIRLCGLQYIYMYELYDHVYVWQCSVLPGTPLKLTLCEQLVIKLSPLVWQVGDKEVCQGDMINVWHLQKAANNQLNPKQPLAVKSLWWSLDEVHDFGNLANTTSGRMYGYEKSHGEERGWGLGGLKLVMGIGDRHKVVGNTIFESAM